MQVITDWKYDEATNLLGRLPSNLNVVADLGAGRRDNPVSLQVREIQCKHLISVEAFEPYLELLLRRSPIAGTHDVVHANLINSNYKLRSCDLVLLLDVIEHLGKEEALELLDYLKTIAKCIVIFTPVGDTIGYTNGDMGNPLQEHKSAWTADEFEEMAFEVTVYEKFHVHLGDIGAMWAIWKSNE